MNKDCPTNRARKTSLLSMRSVWLLLLACIFSTPLSAERPQLEKVTVQLPWKHQGEVHLLLTDLIMPRMGGLELVEKLKTKHQQLKVLYMSGYIGDSPLSVGELELGSSFIQKPFTSVAILKKIRATLDHS